MSSTTDLLRLVIADLFVCTIAVAMAYDLVAFRIPNSVSLALVLLFGLGALAAADPVDWLGHAGAGALLLAVGTVAFARGWLGGGDVKLLVAISVWMGFALLPAYLLAVGLIGGVLALLLLLLRARLAFTEPLWVRVGLAMPRVLRPGEAVPYGIAIGTAALLLSSQMPLWHWN